MERGYIMSVGTVLSAAIIGMRVEFIRVEADVSGGLPGFHMVGYLSSEVKEASERVKTAIKNSKIEFPAKKVVINLSPAHVRKRGASFDLPIAVAVLLALGQVGGRKYSDTVFIGELGLDGSIKKVHGVLPILIEAKKSGVKTCIIPKGNEAEGVLVEDIEVLTASNLWEVYAYLTGEKTLNQAVQRKNLNNSTKQSKVDFSEIQGQVFLKRAAEVAVAGGHNLLLIGPPGSGKSMAAQRIPTILPSLTKEESIEITKIYSILGMLEETHPLILNRPFRSVHHTATRTALTGGGNIPTPGEISLSHGGVLFLDELSEFSKSVLEVLREPLEEQQIRISRSHGSYLFPADFMLVAAMNPCLCGYYPDINKCTCSTGQIQNYLGKISQPFLDRMDICVEVPQVEYESLQQKREEESSKEIRKRVCQAREIQRKRYKGENYVVNARVDLKKLESCIHLGEQEEKLMKQAFTSLHFTARTYTKVLRVARTIADLDACEEIKTKHLREAISYRSIDKKYWGK